MNKLIRIYHSTIELDEIETRYYIVLTEVCLLTNKVIRTYSARLPQWISEEKNPDFEFYQPIFN
jgi:hypothetical protein